MTRPRLSIKGLIVAVAVLGLDFATLVKRLRQGRATHSTISSTIGHGLFLAAFHVLVVVLAVHFAKRSGLDLADRLSSPTSPLVSFGCFAAVLMFAILLVVFTTSGTVSECFLAERSDP